MVSEVDWLSWPPAGWVKPPVSAVINCGEVCSSQAYKAQVPKHIVCVFRGKGRRMIRVAGLLDSGNLIPGSAAISAVFAARIGAVLEPYSLEVSIAAQGGSLE